MTPQLHVANSLVEARARATQDSAVLRDVEIARSEARRERRAARRARN